MVIMVQCGEWEIKKVLIDPWSSTNVLFYDAFKRILLDPYDIQVFLGSLIGLSEKTHACKEPHNSQGNIQDEWECEDDQG